MWPIPEVTTPPVAVPRRCRRSRCGYAESRYPGDAENLCSDVAESVGEKDHHHRHAPHQECSDTSAKDHYHGFHPSTGESASLPGWPINAPRCWLFQLNRRSFDILSVTVPPELAVLGARTQGTRFAALQRVHGVRARNGSRFALRIDCSRQKADDGVADVALGAGHLLA
jgi:hypothetical protein